MTLSKQTGTSCQLSRLRAGRVAWIAHASPRPCCDGIRLLRAGRAGTLPQEFIGDEHGFQRKLTLSVGHPDDEGLFRVEEFFCHANMWLRAATVAATRSDVVVVDARSFTAERKGVRLEIAMLLRTLPCARVLLISDRTTSTSDLDAAEHEAWAQVESSSPNYALGTRSLRRFDIGRATDQELDAACDLIFRLSGEPPAPGVGA